MQRIIDTHDKINEIDSKADVIINSYKKIAAAITTLHISTFGYMIFFVDWLGWDIIEPLTYSVSSIYFMLSIRFYSKFKKDRCDETVR